MLSKAIPKPAIRHRNAAQISNGNQATLKRDRSSRQQAIVIGLLPTQIQPNWIVGLHSNCIFIVCAGVTGCGCERTWLWVAQIHTRTRTQAQRITSDRPRMMRAKWNSNNVQKKKKENRNQVKSESNIFSLWSVCCTHNKISWLILRSVELLNERRSDAREKVTCLGLSKVSKVRSVQRETSLAKSKNFFIIFLCFSSRKS